MIYGGTRSGKSSFIDWQMREISRIRPDCMQVLIDSKPRFRAETERGWKGPKAGEALNGATSIGVRVRLYPTRYYVTFTRIIRSGDSGRVRVKLSSCSQVKRKTGAEC